MRRAVPALPVLLIASAALAQSDDMPLPLAAALETARAECASFDGGSLDIGYAAVSRPDLTGDGTPDWALDESQLACSSAASLFCGTGGCMVTFVVGDTATERLTKGWQVVEFGPWHVVLLQVHGSLCGGINPTPCVEALVWDSDAQRFSTPVPAPSQ